MNMYYRWGMIHNPTYIEILKRADIIDSEVICAYMYGSRVYGNFSDISDWDYIFVMKKKTREQYSDNKININFFDDEGHITRILNHEISALETLFINDNFILKEEKKYSFKLDLQRLRKSISAKSSNSWVKCKKKLTIEKDYNSPVGKKSLWHSLRILDFGSQVAKYHRIVDYKSMNGIYPEIMQTFDWETLFKKYKKKYNNMSSEFRLLAPK